MYVHSCFPKYLFVLIHSFVKKSWNSLSSTHPLELLTLKSNYSCFPRNHGSFEAIQNRPTMIWGLTQPEAHPIPLGGYLWAEKKNHSVNLNPKEFTLNYKVDKYITISRKLYNVSAHWLSDTSLKDHISATYFFMTMNL